MYKHLSEDEQLARIYEQMQRGDKKANQRLKSLQKSQVSKDNNDDGQLNLDTLLESKHKTKVKFPKNKSNPSYNLPSLKNKIQANPEREWSKDEIKNKPFGGMKKVGKEFKSLEKIEVNLEKSNFSKIKSINSKIERRVPSINSNSNQEKIPTESSKNSTPQIKFRKKLKPAEIKQIYDDLVKINEDERILQMDIMLSHHETKQQIDNIVKKYGIKESNNENDEQEKNSMLEEKQSCLTMECLRKACKKSQKIKKEERNVYYFERVLKFLNHQIERKKKQLKKKSLKIQSNPIIQSIKQLEVENISEKESEEQQSEEEEIGELKNNSMKSKINPTQTYRKMMIQMRKKKWKLNKRLNYEYEQQTALTNVSISNSKKNIEIKPDTNKQDGENRVVANSRLKQFLLD